MNCIIYVIRSNETNKIYIGSTINKLNKRWFSHKTNYNLYNKNKNKYCGSFALLYYEDAYIEILENCKVKNIAELHRLENY